MSRFPCALFASVLMALPWPAAAAPAENLALAHEVLQTLIGIDTAEPAGSIKAAEALAARFRAAGLSAQDVQILTPQEHPEKANLVVRLRGRGDSKPVMWIAHLDVVAADPKDWSTPPFTLTEKDGWLYGRGVADMKGEVAAITAALIRLKHDGFTPARDIVAVFTADEEAAGRVDGVRWLLADHRPLLDAAFAVNPDGGVSGRIAGQRRLYRVETAEKAYATYTLTATDRGGHSSQPRPGNAIYRLSAALLRLDSYRFPVHLTATTRGFFRGGAGLESDPLRADMLALAEDPTNASAADRLSARPDFNAQIRTTCVATLVSAGEAENALPQNAIATIQCRLLPGEDPDAVLSTLRQALADPAVAVAAAKAPRTSPETVPDARIMGAIQTAVSGMWGPLAVITTMGAGGSDSVFTRPAGIPTYGAASIFEDTEDNRHHGRDERILAAAFDDGVEFTYRLMKQLSAVQP